jgi:hypothetical protein
MEIVQNRIPTAALDSKTMTIEVQVIYYNDNLSKWFYDISTGAATGAACCGSFVGEGISLMVISYR